MKPHQFALKCRLREILQQRSLLRTRPDKDGVRRVKREVLLQAEALDREAATLREQLAVNKLLSNMVGVAN